MEQTFHKHHLFAFLVVFALVILGKGSSSSQDVVYAADPDANTKFHCWANAADQANGGTAGWISFNDDYSSTTASWSCPTIPATVVTAGREYSVGYNSYSGNLSGHAWSENLGWLSFNRANTGNPPCSPSGSLPCTYPTDPGNGSGPIARVSTTTGEVFGWARFLSACASIPCQSGAPSNGGGWDGWVSFNASSAANNVKFIGNDATGFAWGGDEVGWINFAGTASNGSAFKVVRDTPAAAQPTIALVGSARDLELKFVAARPEKTQKPVNIEVDLKGFAGSTTFSVVSDTVPDGVTITPEFTPTVSGVENNVNFKVTLSGPVDTGTYNITVRATFSGTGAPAYVEQVVKLKVVKIGAGFGEN